MPKQYVFFRTSRGRTRGEKAADRSDTNQPKNDGESTSFESVPRHALAKLGSLSRRGANGKPEWPGWETNDLFSSLPASFLVVDEFGNELNEHDAWKIVWKAISEIVESGFGKPIAITELLSRADKHASAFLRQSRKPYEVATTLSVSDLPSKVLNGWDASISKLKRRKGTYAIPNSVKFSSLGHRLERHQLESKYLHLKIRAEGRSDIEASSVALDALGITRAVWSLVALRGSTRFITGALRQPPIGSFLVGPIHTVHALGGADTEGGLYWINQTYADDGRIFKPQKDWSNLERHRRIARSRLGRCKFRGFIESLLLRYIEALDQPDLDVAFLLLWGILENATNTVGAKYQETIKRALWLSDPEERLVSTDLMNIILVHRNRFVHHGSTHHRRDQLAQLLKTILEPHLIRLVYDHFRLSSKEDYWKLVSLTMNATSLRQQQSLLAKALYALNRADGDS
jgi:hypothetical protein